MANPATDNATRRVDTPFSYLLDKSIYLLSFSRYASTLPPTCVSYSRAIRRREEVIRSILADLRSL